MKPLATAATLLFALLASPLGAQTTRLVPQQFATIGAALAAAQNGDLVLVDPGTYPGDLDFLGKNVEVRSNAGAATTIIDAQGASNPVRIDSGEGPGAILDGFTITNGVGAAATDTSGGLLCRASPRIRNCIFVGCLGLAGGGAVRLREASNAVPAAPRFEDCVFQSNVALSTGPNPPGGGAVLAATVGAAGVDAVFVGCQFIGNACASSMPGTIAQNGGGGAVAASCFVGSQCHLEFVDCTFDGNSAEDAFPAGGGLVPGGGAGGAISLRAIPGSDVRCEARGCVFVGNSAGDANGTGGPGGAIAFENLGSNSALIVRRCDFIGNHAGGSGGGVQGGAGGAIHAVHSSIASDNGIIEVDQCVFAQNAAGDGTLVAGDGGAIAVVSTGSLWSLRVRHSTFTQNAPGVDGSGASGSGGALFADAVTGVVGLAVYQSILYGDLGGEIGVAPGSNLFTDVDTCNIQGGFSGPGILDVPPQFVSPATLDLRLAPGSPMIDAGCANYITTPLDRDGHPRRAGASVDLGAHEFGPWPQFPGTTEDLQLAWSLNGGPDSYGTGVGVAAGDVFAVRPTTPCGTFTGVPTYVLAQGYFGGSSGPVASTAFPGLWVNATATAVQDAAFVAWGPVAASAAGTAFSTTVPAGLGGYTVRFQAVGSTPFARNFYFVASDAYDFVITGP
ncbi:MAG: choice-of-anchor Q domain-containing protein [Planctomycetota bacterium]